MSAPDTTARKGKIGRMPKTVRDELNARLRDGESSATILPWLNALPAVKAILKKGWRGEAVSDQNLSAWRNGGYKEWLQRQEELDQTKGLVEFSADLTRKTGGSPADAAANLSGSRLLAALDEHLTPSAISELLADRPKDLLSLVEKVVQLQAEENRKAKLQLDRAGFEMKYCQGILKGAEDKAAQRIAGLNVSNDEKISLLRKHYFADVDALQKSGMVKLPD